jgi:hypothetical protein
MLGKRELIDTGRNKLYVRRDARGRFSEVVDVGNSADRRHDPQKTPPDGQGDRGDRQTS